MSQPLSSNILEFLKALPACAKEKGYTIDQVIDGETVAEVLDYVQYSPVIGSLYSMRGCSRFHRFSAQWKNERIKL